MGAYNFWVWWRSDFHSILMVFQAKALDAVVVILSQISSSNSINVFSTLDSYLEQIQLV